MKKINPLKTVKRAFYRERLEKFKRLSVLMLAAGAVFGLLYCSMQNTTAISVPEILQRTAKW